MSADEILSYYNQRQTVEARIKSNKNGLYINHLRTKHYFGIQAVMYFAAIINNLLSIFRHQVLKGTPLENFGLTELVQRLMDIPAKIHKYDGYIEVALPSRHIYSRLFVKNRGLVPI